MTKPTFSDSGEILCYLNFCVILLSSYQIYVLYIIGYEMKKTKVIYDLRIRLNSLFFF